jgi:uncharacterized protein GlcG (DUF336 family)
MAMRISTTRETITSEAALAAVVAAVAHGRSLGVAVVAAVVDAGGDLLACVRADGAYPASVGIARDKAYTATVFRAATDEFGKALSSNLLLAAGISQRPGVVLFGGGLPIISGDRVIGAIGVSGGSEENDRACAAAGRAVLKVAPNSALASN